MKHVKNSLIITGLFLVILFLFTSCSSSDNKADSNKTETTKPTYTSAPAAQPFSLHSDTYFGMSPEKVLATEASAGFDFEETTDGNLYIDKGLYRLESNLITVAGNDRTSVTYFFDSNKKMSTCMYMVSGGLLYAPNITDNQRVLETMIGKYGNPVSSGDNYIDLGSSYNALDYYRKYYKVNNGSGGYVFIDDFNQWIVESNDGYVNIMYVTFHWKSSSSGTINDLRIITYSHVTTQEWNAYKNMNQEINHSLNQDL